MDEAPLRKLLPKKPSFSAFIETQPDRKVLFDGTESSIQRRRKRNRVSSEEHRARKKRYIEYLETTIYKLERENLQLRQTVENYELEDTLKNFEDENWSLYDPQNMFQIDGLEAFEKA